jgi:hypothetical protein
MTDRDGRPSPNTPIRKTVVRWQCPHCPRSASSRPRISEHVARCWSNPDARSCKTCEHANESAGYVHSCGVGVKFLCSDSRHDSPVMPVNCDLWVRRADEGAES